MTETHYEQYVDRLEDLGMQVLDLVAELRADPPRFCCGSCARVPIVRPEDLSQLRGVKH